MKFKEIKSQILGEQFIYDLLIKNSKLNVLIDKYIFLFILENLSLNKRKIFLELLSANSSLNIDALTFAKNNIEQFDYKLKNFLIIKFKGLVTI